MTETEWNACTDPLPMMKHLEGIISERKLRLFVCACCWRVMPLIPSEQNRTVLATAERYADERKDSDAWDDLQGLCPPPAPTVDERLRTPDDRANWTTWAARDAYHALWAGALHVPTGRHWFWKAVRGATEATADAVGDLARARACAQSGPDSDERINAGRRAVAAERAAQCRLLRDISGNPFRPLAADPTWLTPSVPGLAETIYQERAFDRLPILADALEDAGCTNADILNHCRQPGEHVRGCWVIDLLTGRQ